MADDTPELPEPAPKSGGCLGQISFVLQWTIIVGLGTLLYFLAQPQDLATKIDGYGPEAARTPVRDLRTVLRNAANRGYSLTLTEEELNRYLANTLRARQGGLLSAHVTLDGVWLNLEPNRIEVILERHILGHPSTISLFLRVDQRIEHENNHDIPLTEIHRDGGPYLNDSLLPNQGGRFGRLVVPEGFLVLALPSLEKLAAAYSEEIRLALSEMGTIQIEDGRIILHPHDELSGLPF